MSKEKDLILGSQHEKARDQPTPKRDLRLREESSNSAILGFRYKTFFSAKAMQSALRQILLRTVPQLGFHLCAI
ncbi:MAG: hypothetical protein DMF27_09585 [Verrucomicrobia bacterium]|nr:MAG: hypothetical protein DMF27_09585 [Verrucomicrobiota bacterium]